ncbi:hypothetical protein E3I90_01530 [Candidatus Bathyarchaeota archaeon]|nr:MAG: hypothetical protein E3I90_01530 [Candidatus Bathyarchaeota archaeon]
MRLHTLRHWKATMHYHQTKDISYVMNFLGHKNTKNTSIYTQLVNPAEDEYVSKVARTVNEARELVEAALNMSATSIELGSSKNPSNY